MSMDTEPAYIAELTTNDLETLKNGGTITFQYPEAVIEQGLRFDIELSESP